MDAIDFKMLEILQRNGRISNADLAEQVNLSPTPCLKRLRKLEKSGVITGYKAMLDTTKVGFNISSLILIKMSDNTRESVNEFTEAINKIPSITECYMATGRIDYVARVYAKNFADYEAIIRDDIARIPNIRDMETVFLFSNCVPDESLKFGI